MSSPIVFPSIRSAVIEFMSEHDLLDGVRVAPNLNGYTGSESWVTVAPSPGSRRTRDRLDARGIQLEAYAPTLDETDTLIDRALAVLLSAKGLTTDTLVVTEVEVSTTPFDLTDQLNGRYRYVCDVTVYYRPI